MRYRYSKGKGYMNMGTEKWIRSIAKRNLHGLHSFESGSLPPEDLKRLLAEGEIVLGRYIDHSVAKRNQQSVIVTDQRILVGGDDDWEAFAYSDIAHSGLIEDKAAVDGIHVTLKSGQIVFLPITGANEKYRDRYVFARFLDRAVAMTKKYDEQPWHDVPR